MAEDDQLNHNVLDGLASGSKKRRDTNHLATPSVKSEENSFFGHPIVEEGPNKNLFSLEAPPLAFGNDPDQDDKNTSHYKYKNPKVPNNSGMRLNRSKSMVTSNTKPLGTPNMQELQMLTSEKQIVIENKRVLELHYNLLFALANRSRRMTLEGYYTLQEEILSNYNEDTFDTLLYFIEAGIEFKKVVNLVCLINFANHGYQRYEYDQIILKVVENYPIRCVYLLLRMDSFGFFSVHDDILGVTDNNYLNIKREVPQNKAKLQRIDSLSEIPDIISGPNPMSSPNIMSFSRLTASRPVGFVCELIPQNVLVFRLKFILFY